MQYLALVTGILHTFSILLVIHPSQASVKQIQLLSAIVTHIKDIFWKHYLSEIT